MEADLTAACLEVSHEDPLGAYAVDYIKHEFSRILTYYQATITIGYRRTLEQIRSVVPVTGSSAIRSEVQGALAQFQPRGSDGGRRTPAPPGWGHRGRRPG